MTNRNSPCAKCSEPTYSDSGLCRTHMAEAGREWVNANRERAREIGRAYYARNREARLEKDRKANWQLKLSMIEAYGGLCKCCGIDEPRFLSIDHVEGGGYQHRQSLKAKGKGSSFYRWLRDEGWPQNGYRLLCYNCNLSRGFYGGCPHEAPVAAAT